MTTSQRYDGHSPGRLSVGSHLSPEDGTCLMEAVSVAAHLPWGDAPSCTHPLLAHLARLVNDTMSEEGRQTLTDLIPGLVSAGTTEPSAVVRVSARVAAACTERALALHSNLLLVHLHHVAVAQLRRDQLTEGRDLGLGVRSWRWLFSRGPAARGVEAAVAACLRLPEAERDAALRQLLDIGLGVARDAHTTGRTHARSAHSSAV